MSSTVRMPYQTEKCPIALMCVAASPDVALLSQWENHLIPLQQAGLLTFWSERQIVAGADRMAELVRHLDQVDSVILLLSSDFFADNTCLTLMREALRRKSTNHTRLIPLLVRPVTWQESELGTFATLPTNGIAITTWESPDEGWRQAVIGLQRLLGFPVHKASSVSKGVATDRERMLRLLRRTYQTSLSNSLQDIAWIELGLSERPDAVRNATHLLQRLPDSTERLLPAGTRVLSVYDQAEEELLILGAPGAGKSTLLLDLAMSLIARAEAQAAHPLPMIVPLSSWAEKRPPLAEWLVEQLARIYDVPRRLGKLWVEQGQVLPLLDGLDEMEEASRPLCIAAINAYRAEHVTPLVACSRQAEYEAASKPNRLLLQNAVVVQALTREQADSVLRQGGPALSELHDALIQNPTLHDLITTPLMLSVLILAYRGKTIDSLPDEQSRLEERIWTDYVERMVREKGAERQSKQDIQSKRYSLEQTRTSLSWLAQQMQAHNQTLLSGESLRETAWLPASKLRVGWWLMDLLPAIVLGAMSGVLLICFLNPYAANFPTTLCVIALLGGFLGWCLCPTPHEHLTPFAQRAGWRRVRKNQRVRLLAAGSLALLSAASFGFHLGNDYLSNDNCCYSLSDWGHDGICIGCILLVGAWLLQMVLPWSDRPALRWKRLPAWLRSAPLRQALWTGAILGSCMALDAWLSPKIIYDPPLVHGLVWGFLSGGTSYLVSGILDGQIGTVRLAEQVSWTWHGLLHLGHLRASLIIALVAGCISGLDGGIFSGLSFGLIIGLIFGVGTGVSYWLIIGLYRGMSQKHLEDRDRRRFNQGLRRSLRNGVLLGLLGAGIMVGIGLLSYELSLVLSVALSYGLSIGLSAALSYILIVGLRVSWLFLLTGWLVLWAATGGLTILRHYTLRLLLAHNHTFPLNARRFLDDACTRVLLRRVGGSYGFVHRRLLDYFAALSDVSEPSRLSTVPPAIPLEKMPTAPLSENISASICRACSYQETRPQAWFCPRCGNPIPAS